MRTSRTCLVPILMLLTACTTSATSSPVPNDIETYYRTTYQSQPGYKAIAVAATPFFKQDGWTGAWVYDQPSAKQAIATAMRECEKYKAKYEVNAPCRLYAVDDTIVWDKSDEEIASLTASNFSNISVGATERNEPAPSGDKSPDSIETRLAELKNLLDRHLITEDEYKAKRGEILSEL